MAEKENALGVCLLLLMLKNLIKKVKSCCKGMHCREVCDTEERRDTLKGEDVEAARAFMEASLCESLFLSVHFQ